MMKRFSIPALAALMASLAALLAAGAWRAREARLQGGKPAAAEEIKAPAKVMYNCAMHPSYISDQPGKCPFCGMDLTPMAATAEAGQDQAAAGATAPSGTPAGEGTGGADGAARAGRQAVRIDPVTVQNIGVRVEPVGRRELAAEVRAGGRIAVDESRQFSVNARVMGWAERLHASTTGRPVRKDEPLLELYSPELVSTQEEYLQAMRYARNLDRAGTSGTSSASASAAASGSPGASEPGGASMPAGPSGLPVAGGHVEEARRAAAELQESARRRLLNWGFPASRIQALEERGAPERSIPILSPASGVVLEKMVIQGQNVMPGMPLYRIADLSRVWVIAAIYQGDLARVKVGSPAEITLSYLPGRRFEGKVAFISPVLDPQSRTAEVRVEVANAPTLDLRPEMFATVTLRPRTAGPVLAVPEQAIIRSGRRNVAIVALGGGYFEPRDVVLGRSADGYAEVLEGLAEGESLVISSQFLIDSESNLRAAIQQMQAKAGTGAENGAGADAGAATGTGTGTEGAGGAQ